MAKRVSFRLITDNDLQAQHERLWNLSDKQSDFVSMATHQLKAPLAGIKWTLNMLLSEEAGPLTDEQKEWLQTSYESNERVLVLINEMLESIRIDEDKLTLDKESVNIVDLFNEITEHLRPLLKKKNVTLSMDTAGEKDITIFLDRSRLQVAFQNLIENAIRYTEQNGHIKVQIIKESGDVKVAIADDGIGIPDSEKQAIFKRFFRASNAFREIEQGTGLGLFIAKGIIEKHGGKIWFESKEGKGTTFYFIIPTS